MPRDTCTRFASTWRSRIASPIKHEFFAGEIYAMAGGTPEHTALCAALIYQLVSKLRGGPCRAYTSDLRVRVLATGLGDVSRRGRRVW